MTPIEWDYPKTYSYALSLLNKKTYSSNMLTQKLITKAPYDIVMQVMQVIAEENLIHDAVLCNETALMWIEKKTNKLYTIMAKIRTLWV